MRRRAEDSTENGLADWISMILQGEVQELVLMGDDKPR